ncbi:hypothetical protein Q8A67_001951 [Cirrhinus molitorella]|uniref:Uncharacterized protein n=1 Tax=Cirrhinus molitorella TaxID=172907 RepID=A0AA88TVI1_9TELE|nr:hypothetical protein Q8A67_001951 [Cirrhinus molitorella]
MAKVHLWLEVVAALQDRLFDLCCSRSSDEYGGSPALRVASPSPLNSCPHPSEKDPKSVYKRSMTEISRESGDLATQTMQAWRRPVLTNTTHELLCIAGSRAQDTTDTN